MTVELVCLHKYSNPKKVEEKNPLATVDRINKITDQNEKVTKRKKFFLWLKMFFFWEENRLKINSLLMNFSKSEKKEKKKKI